MSKIAVPITDMFEDIEYEKPVESYKNAGHEIINVGIEKKIVKGKQGLEVQIDKTFREVTADDFDAVFIPGGFSPDILRIEEDAVNFVKDFYETGKQIFMICHAPQILITADLLIGRTVTGWKSIVQDLKNAGANYVDEPVAIDNNLISSRGPDDIDYFIEATLIVLKALL